MSSDMGGLEQKVDKLPIKVRVGTAVLYQKRIEYAPSTGRYPQCIGNPELLAMAIETQLYTGRKIYEPFSPSLERTPEVEMALAYSDILYNDFRSAKQHVHTATGLDWNNQDTSFEANCRKMILNNFELVVGVLMDGSLDR